MREFVLGLLIGGILCFLLCDHNKGCNPCCKESPLLKSPAPARPDDRCPGPKCPRTPRRGDEAGCQPCAPGECRGAGERCPCPGDGRTCPCKPAALPDAAIEGPDARGHGCVCEKCGCADRAVCPGGCAVFRRASLSRPEAFVPGGPQLPDGRVVSCDMPISLYQRNVGGSDGAGLCVFSSIANSAQWQNVNSLKDFKDWMRKHPGGGYPQKVDAMIARLCQERGVPKPRYLQIENGDLEILKLALRTGRMPAVTYNGRDNRYRSTIAHMVSLVALRDGWACINDNNFPNEYLYMTEVEFKSRFDGGSKGWAVVLLDPGPPPIPTLQGSVQGSASLHRVGCPGGNCAAPSFSMPAVPVNPPSFVPPPPPLVLSPAVKSPEYSWVADQSAPGWYYLYRGDRQVGAIDPLHGYCPLLTSGDWGESCSPPIPAPRQAGMLPGMLPENLVGDVIQDNVLNFGVDLSKLGQREKYSVAGREVTRKQAFEILTQDGLIDDSRKLRLTVVGSDDLCKRVLNDLNTVQGLSELKDHLLVQAYEPDEWPIKGLGMDGVTVQAPPDKDGRGKVLFRLRNYDPNLLLIQLRKADPNRNPANDPDPARPLDSWVSQVKQLPGYVWLIGGACLYLLWTRRGESK